MNFKLQPDDTITFKEAGEEITLQYHEIVRLVMTERLTELLTDRIAKAMGRDVG